MEKKCRNCQNELARLSALRCPLNTFSVTCTNVMVDSVNSTQILAKIYRSWFKKNVIITNFNSIPIKTSENCFFNRKFIYSVHIFNTFVITFRSPLNNETLLEDKS